MRLEGGAFLADFCKVPQAEYLEASTVGQNGPFPIHERVEPTETFDQFMTGPNEEMICITENYLGVHLIEIFRGDSLDCGLGAHRHEDRRLDSALPSGDMSAARTTLR